MPEPVCPTPSLFSRVVWLMMAKSIAFAIGLALPLVLVRQFTQTDFGLYKQVFLVVSSATTVLPFGFAMSAFYFLPREPARRPHVAFNILTFHLAVGGLASLALLAWPSLLARLFNGPELLEYAPAIAGLLFLGIVASTLDVMVLANNESRLGAAFIMMTTFSRSLLMLVAALAFGSLRALVWAALVQGVLHAALVLVYLKSRFPGFWRAGDTRLLRAQVAYAFPVGLAGLLYVIQHDLHNYFVAHSFSAAVYALYAVGCFQLPFVPILTESVSSVTIPTVSRLQAEQRSRDIVVLTAHTMRTLAAVSFPLYGGLLLLGPELITVLFTASYRDSWPIFAINLTLIPFAVISSAADPVFRAFPDALPPILRARFLLLGVLVAALWLGIARFGLIGAIATMVSLNVIDRLLMGVVAARRLRVSWADLPLLTDLGKLALAVLAATGAAAGTRAFSGHASPLRILIVCGLVYCVTYALGALALGVLTPAERAALVRRVGVLRLWKLQRRSAPLVSRRTIPTRQP